MPHAAPVMQELPSERHRVLSRMVYQTFNGYVLSQFKRIEADVCVFGVLALESEPVDPRL